MHQSASEPLQRSKYRRIPFMPLRPIGLGLGQSLISLETLLTHPRGKHEYWRYSARVWSTAASMAHTQSHFVTCHRGQRQKTQKSHRHRQQEMKRTPEAVDPATQVRRQDRYRMDRSKCLVARDEIQRDSPGFEISGSDLPNRRFIETMLVTPWFP